MGRLTSVTVGPLVVAAANNIAQSQSPGAGAITLNGSLVVGGVAILDATRRIRITSGGNDSGITFTINGTDWNGSTIANTITGANASTADSTLDFATVTSVTHTGTIAGTVTVGTNGIASSRPIFLDAWAAAQVALQVDVTGTVNATVQQTLDDPNAVGLANVNWVNHADTNLVGLTATVQGNYAYAPVCTRILVNSQTNPGAVTYRVQQLGGSV